MSDITYRVAAAISMADHMADGDYRKLAKAALEATASYIEEVYGELHPGVVCIRTALSNGHHQSGAT